MYKVCPKCNYEINKDDPLQLDTCPACGIIFSKWLKQKFRAEASPVQENFTTQSNVILRMVCHRLIYVEPNTDPYFFYPRVILFLIFMVWGWQFIMMDFINNPYEIGRSFMHNINLVFHEAGHVFFIPLGWFMTILGGTLGQLIMPLVVMLVFMIKNQDNFAASIGLWWLGQSLMDSAPYIDDALEQKLVLLGGHTGADAPGNHDWNNILGEFNMLERHREFASLADNTGTIIMLISFIWGGVILYRQFMHIK